MLNVISLNVHVQFIVIICLTKLLILTIYLTNSSVASETKFMPIPCDISSNVKMHTNREMYSSIQS